MSTKRELDQVAGPSTDNSKNNNGQGYPEDNGNDEHIDKKFKQVNGDEDEADEDEDEDVPKSGKRAGRRKIKIEYIEDKSRRHITFSKRKSGIMKKAFELSTLTGTQVLLLVVSETGLVYTFTTPKLQPLVTKSEGKNLIQACLHAPDKDPTPERYDGAESPEAEGSEQDNEDRDASPAQQAPQPSAQQQQQPPPPQQQPYSQQQPQQQQQQQGPPPGYPPSAAMGMYPPPYSHIPFPAGQGSSAGPYSYPNMGMNYQGGPPGPGGPPPPPQYWAPTPPQAQLQQSQQQQQQSGSGAPNSSPIPASASNSKGRGDK
ncbi:transcription factor of the MADS box [Haplosporangium sp. Z 767]|nr:transcription factor of the MADS box [Haplosporangium sp. Z 767]KAF9189333.1 transcription factor of the MADS box [Haplosporangium sp. Z 11]